MFAIWVLALLFGALLVLFLVGLLFGSEDEPAPAPSPTATGAPAPTQTPQTATPVVVTATAVPGAPTAVPATATAVPSPRPTSTPPPPTQTPEPTATPAPTETPAPTAPPANLPGLGPTETPDPTGHSHRIPFACGLRPIPRFPGAPFLPELSKDVRELLSEGGTLVASQTTWEIEGDIMKHVIWVGVFENPASQTDVLDFFEARVPDSGWTTRIFRPLFGYLEFFCGDRDVVHFGEQYIVTTFEAGELSPFFNVDQRGIVMASFVPEQS